MKMNVLKTSELLFSWPHLVAESICSIACASSCRQRMVGGTGRGWKQLARHSNTKMPVHVLHLMQEGADMTLRS